MFYGRWLRAPAGPFPALASEPPWMSEIAHILRDRLGLAADRVSTRGTNDRLVRPPRAHRPPLREVIPQPGAVRRASNEQARSALGWPPRPNEELVADDRRAWCGSAW